MDFSLPDADGRSATGEKSAGSSRNDDSTIGSPIDSQVDGQKTKKPKH